MATGGIFDSCVPMDVGKNTSGLLVARLLWNASFPLLPANGTPGDVIPGGGDFNASFLGASTHAPTAVKTTENAIAAAKERYEVARSVLNVFHPIICVFGLLGNILTLLILTRKRLKMSCDGTERTVHIGLTALAVSDFLFCLTVLPTSLFDHRQFFFPTRSFQLVYKTYGNALINTFILTSTLLTVTMATSRYLAICHPFRARHLIGTKGTKTSILLVFLTSTVFNIPRMLASRIESIECQNGRRIYYARAGYIETGSRADTIYTWVYFTVGIVLPLATLAFCNICLVNALRESVKIRRRYRVPAAHVDSNYRITSILVTIVVMYIVLVSPAEILLFIQQRLSNRNEDGPALVFAVEVTNLLQIINFSCNFVLYFVLNVHFRRGLRDMFGSCCARFCARQRKEDPVSKLPLNRQISMRTTQTLV